MWSDEHTNSKTQIKNNGGVMWNLMHKMMCKVDTHIVNLGTVNNQCHYLDIKYFKY